MAEEQKVAGILPHLRLGCHALTLVKVPKRF
jgi:hypothetical protein